MTTSERPASGEVYPTVRSLKQHNLPIQLSSFVGRQHELSEIKRLVQGNRLITLSGTGGVGKTRLAIQAAAHLLREFTAGLWLVELAALTDPALVSGAVASVLGVKEEAREPIVETLARALQSKHVLLVLDNCEHLIETCAELCDGLLRNCLELHILATSREPLGVSGEVAWRVPSLALPGRGRRDLGADDLLRSDATRLFVERARAGHATFDLTERNLGAVVELCERLDGIPLAIELAAARVRVLAVEQIVARLDDRFRLLTGGSRTTPARHQSMRATIEWSYDLLAEPERTLFVDLSVFAGGWTLEAAEAVCARSTIHSEAILDLLTRLVDRSLVAVDTSDDTTVRYRLLESLRAYAWERLLANGNAATVQRQHALYFVSHAERAEPELRGPNQRVWLDQLEREHDNLRAALTWCASSGEAELGLRLAAALSWLWEARGYVTEGRGWLSAVLLQSGETRPASRAQGPAPGGHVGARPGRCRRRGGAFSGELAVVGGDQ